MTRLQGGRRTILPRLDEAAFARFLDEDDGLPVVIFNLLRFDTDTGPGRCSEAVARIRPELERYGAELVYVGEGPAMLWDDGSGLWDAVAIVQYPSRRAFADMVETSEYFEVPSSLRDATLLEVVLRPIQVVN